MRRGSGRGRKRRRLRKPARMHKAARAVAAHSHTDAGPDRIVCLLCGRTYRAVNYWHLMRIHGFDGEHPVHDYKKMFGLRVAACQEMCERAREVQVERHEKAGRHWTTARIVRTIRQRARQGLPLARMHVPTRLSQAGVRLLGSWDAALRAAGQDPVRHRILTVWSHTRVLDAIRSRAQDRRATSTRTRQEAPALHRAACRRFGSWRSALRAAGLDPRAHSDSQVWSLERAAQWVDRRIAAGQCIRARTAPSGLQAFVRRETGLTWSGFVASLGVRYPERPRYCKWSNADVLSAIRRRKRRKLPLNYKAVVRDEGQAITEQARRRFGSWDSALRAAGVEPMSVRLSRTWTKADVISGIRTRMASGKSLAFAAASEEDPRLVRAALRCFPFSWGKALGAAGLDPSLARVGVPLARGRAGRAARTRKHK